MPSVSREGPPDIAGIVGFGRDGRRRPPRKSSSPSPSISRLTGQSPQFDAYGRRFSLTLADNERVLDKLPAAAQSRNSQSYRLLRGSLDGPPGSWVRLTESPAGVEGAIWDGHDLYAVTRYDAHRAVR